MVQPQNDPKKTRPRRKRTDRTPLPEADAVPELERAEALADVAEGVEAAPPYPAEATAVLVARPPAVSAENREAAAPTAAPAPVKRRRRGRRGGRSRGRGGDRSLSPEVSAPVSPRRFEAGREAPARRTVEPPEIGNGAASVLVPAGVRPVETRVADRPLTPSAPRSDKQYEHEMLINVAEGDECRIAIVHKGRLEELFVERSGTESHVGNIYKGRVTNVEPSIQAAFVDFGLAKNGFLHISDLQPQYFTDRKSEPENVGKKTPRRERPPIQRCLRRGQEIIVQVIKEGIGTKGPTLTTYISLPGRYLVMMPGMSRLGVSRKIEDDDARRSMRSVLAELELPKGMGFILRTAGLGQTKRELQRDLNYLSRLWKAVAQRIKNERAPALLYQESDLVIRTIRDVFGSDIDRIVADDEATAVRVREFLEIANPRTHSLVQCYAGPLPLFHKYGLEEEIQKLNSKHVPLPSGGSLVIESTEALVAIDVNSGRYRVHDNAENTALKINQEAADEIARQLRLRDLGGLIICDFIDMALERNRRAVERQLREALKKHKERAKILRMSQFGIIEMTRQRQRPSIKRSLYQDCPNCHGAGQVKTPGSVALEVLRLIRSESQRGGQAVIEIQVHPDVANHLQNRNRMGLCELERRAQIKIVVRANPAMGPDQIEYQPKDAAGRLVAGNS